MTKSLYIIIPCILFFGFIIWLVIYLTTKPEEIISTTPSTQKGIITFKSVPGVDYTTSNNIPKSYTLGTFTTSINVTELLFTFNITDSVFNNSSVNLIIKDNNDNNIYNNIISDFTTSPVTINNLNIPINNQYKLILTISGDNVRLISPSVTLTYDFTKTTTTLQPTTMMPSTLQPTTMLPTTMQPTTMLPTTMQPTTMMPSTMQPTTMMPSTMQPTTMLPTTMMPSTMQPTTMMPTTMMPSTMQPTTMLPTTMMPSTMQPTTMMPTTMMPSTMQPTTMMPSTMQPTTMMPTTMMPSTMQPTTMMPSTMQPTTMMPTTMIPSTMQPTTMMPSTMQPTTMMPSTMMPINILPGEIPIYPANTQFVNNLNIKIPYIYGLENNIPYLEINSFRRYDNNSKGKILGYTMYKNILVALGVNGKIYRNVESYPNIYLEEILYENLEIKSLQFYTSIIEYEIFNYTLGNKETSDGFNINLIITGSFVDSSGEAIGFLVNNKRVYCLNKLNKWFCDTGILNWEYETNRDIISNLNSIVTNSISTTMLPTTMMPSTMQPFQYNLVKSSGNPQIINNSNIILYKANDIVTTLPMYDYNKYNFYMECVIDKLNKNDIINVGFISDDVYKYAIDCTLMVSLDTINDSFGSFYDVTKFPLKLGIYLSDTNIKYYINDKTYEKNNELEKYPGQIVNIFTSFTYLEKDKLTSAVNISNINFNPTSK